MYRSPSIKFLVERLNFTILEAKHFKSKCKNDTITHALEYADYILEGFGIESLYPDYKDFQYINMGDTYDLTICFTGKSFIIDSWGNWVENHPIKE